MRRSPALVLLLALLLCPGVPRPHAQEPAAEGTAVLSREEAVAEGREFLDLLREGKGEAMYVRLDPFSRLRWTEEQFVADIRRLLDQYGPVLTLKLTESRDGSPFFHAYYEVKHERSVVLYHLVLTVSGAVMRFEVEAVDGKKLETPTP